MAVISIKGFIDDVKIGDIIWIKYKTEFLRRQREDVGYVTEMNTGTVVISSEMPPLGKKTSYGNEVWYSGIEDYRKLDADANLEARVKE